MLPQKSHLSKVSALLLVIALLGHAAASEKETKSTLQSEARIERRLDRIIIPKLSFQNATLREVVDFLKRKSADLEDLFEDSGKRRAGDFKPASPLALPAAPGTPIPEPTPNDFYLGSVEPRITFFAANIPLREVLRYLSRVTQTKFLIRADGVHMVRPALDYLHEALKIAEPADEFPVPGPEVPKVVETNSAISNEEPGRNAVALERKMRRTILPTVTLDHVNVGDAISTLGWMSRVPFILENFIDSPATQPRPTITYSAAKISLHDAVEAIARLAQCHVHLDGNVIVLTLPLPTDTLITKTYLIPPKSESTLEQRPSPPSSVDLEKATEWLSAGEGVSELAPGAIYLASKRCLSVRDTGAKQQVVRETVEKGWREYYASDEWKKRKAR